MTLPLLGILLGGIWLYSGIRNQSVVSIFTNSAGGAPTPTSGVSGSTSAGGSAGAGVTGTTGPTNTVTAQGSAPNGPAPAPSTIANQSANRIMSRFLADLNRTRPPASDLAGSGWEYDSGGNSIIPTPGQAGAVARQAYVIAVMDGQIGQP